MILFSINKLLYNYTTFRHITLLPLFLFWILVLFEGRMVGIDDLVKRY